MRRCEYCKQSLEDTNPKLVLMRLTAVGYREFNFCGEECLIRFIAKKFKRIIGKM